MAYEPDPGRSDAVAVSRAFLAENLTGRPTLAEAASAAGVDRFTLLRRFRRELNTTPHAYLVMLRLTRAQARLAGGAPAAEAAAESGSPTRPTWAAGSEGCTGSRPPRTRARSDPQLRYRPCRRRVDTLVE